VNGPAISGGLELALACDIRIAAPTAAFSLPEVTQGAIPGGGGTQRLPRIVGRAKALDMVLTGRTLDADEALRCGLVTSVADDEDCTAEAISLAGRIAERGPLAVRYAKEAVHRGTEMPLEQALRYETDLTVILQTTNDRAEGVRAFVEKRKPQFDGT
jgi:enoyl-CoA hydratase/carnithine racemase